MDVEHPFTQLTPERVMDAVESCGYHCDCRTFALNSYENRVYQVGIDDAQPLIVKFYRPERWSLEQIREEHHFTLELASHELPVVPPLCNDYGETLHTFAGFSFALYPRQGGHAPEFDNPEQLLSLGRCLGRIHRIGSVRPFAFRPTLDRATFGAQSVAMLRDRFVPLEYRANYVAVTDDLLATIDDHFAAAAGVKMIRTHGDCHSGNILWRGHGPHFVDFDDARMAPAVQDLWMMLSGDDDAKRGQLEIILRGYDEFHDFDRCELRLIEALRALRMLHYCAWLATRWSDPIFPATFPWFNSARYWEGHIGELREQLAQMQEPPLQL